MADKERLLLLKGTRANLATKSINPGAIYFTTDYPGIYVDLAAEGTQGQDGYKAARRMRMGDVTVVDKLKDLQDLVNLKDKADGLTTPDGAEEFTLKTSSAAPILTDKTLYYAITENVLCMYDEAGKRFIWINDHTALNNAISQINSDINGINNKITELQGAVNTTIPGQIQDLEQSIGDINELIGTPGTDDAYKASSIFAALEDINDRIAAVLGGGTDSIATLKQAIADEVTNRTNADTALGGRIDGVKADIGYTKPENGKSLKELLDAVDKDLQDTKSAQDTINKNLEKADEDLGKEIDTVAKDLEDEISNRKNADAGLAGDIEEVDKKIDALDDRIGYSATAQAGQSNKTFYEVYTETVKTLNDTDKTNTQLIDKNTQDISTNAADIATNKDNISNLGVQLATETENREKAIAKVEEDYAKADAETLAAAQQYVNDHLSAADAMTFMGTVGYKAGETALDLPTGQETDDDGQYKLVKAGDTYVVKEDVTGSVYHAGDLMVALEDQKLNDDGTVTAYPLTKWSHVKTGYDVAHEAKLSVDNSKPAINLTPHTGTGSLGSITFSTSESSNIEIDYVSGQNGSININLVWGTF